jgi:hypothetical protein
LPSPEEIARRKALKQAARQAERDQIRSTLPIPPTQMRSLFDFVDQRLSETDCDGSLQQTLAFLGQRQLPVDPVIKWLESTGGNCDCEVLANSEERFLFACPEDEP